MTASPPRSGVGGVHDSHSMPSDEGPAGRTVKSRFACLEIALPPRRQLMTIGGLGAETAENGIQVGDSEVTKPA